MARAGFATTRLHLPGRHGSHAVPDPRAVPDARGVASGVPTGRRGHRRAAFRVVAAYAVLVGKRRHVHEGDGLRRGTGLRLGCVGRPPCTGTSRRRRTSSRSFFSLTPRRGNAVPPSASGPVSGTPADSRRSGRTPVGSTSGCQSQLLGIRCAVPEENCPLQGLSEFKAGVRRISERLREALRRAPGFPAEAGDFLFARPALLTGPGLARSAGPRGLALPRLPRLGSTPS